MIIAKEIINLCEEWSKSTIAGGERVDIYENPGSSDITKIVKSIRHKEKLIRFIADAKSPQKVYVWDSSLAVHSEIFKTLGYNFNDWMNLPNILVGYGHITSGKIILGDEFGSIESLLGAVSALCDFKSPQPSWKKKYGKEVSTVKKYLSDLFEYNWLFLDKYISGSGPFIGKEKQRFLDWIKIYDNS